MFSAFARIFIILFAVGVYGSTNHHPIVHIKDTKLIGSLHKNHQVEMFLGLPFAVPPIGDLRWEKPVPWVPESNKKIIANKFKPACIQNQRIVNWYKRLILDFGGDPEDLDVPVFSEDCLYLNLWRQKGSKNNLPVIVYIHGGSNKAGWSYEPNYLGHNISHLIASPLSKDLFHKAVHQSGGSSFTYPTLGADVRKLANNFANSFKDPSIKNLKNISSEEILKVSEEVYAEHYFNYVDDNLSL